VIARILFLAAFFCVLPAGAALADEGKLLGSTIALEPAIAKADAIFAGQLISLTPGDASNPGVLVGKVKFLSGARSGVTMQTWTQDGGMSGALNIDHDGEVQVAIPDSAAAGEVAPQVGTSYVFWVTGVAREGVWVFPVFKIYPSTPQINSEMRHLVHRLRKT
jgi:hypothetical protein